MLRTKPELPSRLSHNNNTPRRRWLVDELDWQRDGESIIKLFKSNFDRRGNKIDYQDDRFYKRLSGFRYYEENTKEFCGEKFFVEHCIGVYFDVCHGDRWC